MDSTLDKTLDKTLLKKTSLSRKEVADAERMDAEIERRSSNNTFIRQERNMVSFLCIIGFFRALSRNVPGKLVRNLHGEISKLFEQLDSVPRRFSASPRAININSSRWCCYVGGVGYFSKGWF